MKFGKAFEHIRTKTDAKTDNSTGTGSGMRLPHWREDVKIRVQHPDFNSKMSAPYLYVESRFGKVPWKETMIELFSEDWELC